MTEADRSRFAQCMALLAATFTENLTATRAEIYFDALRDLAIADVETAVRAHIRLSKFFPRPAELRELAGGGMPDIGAAYAALLLAKRHGYFDVPDLPPVLEMVVPRLGGWRRLFDMTDDELWRRFKTVYEPVRTAAEARGYSPALEAPKRVALPPPHIDVAGIGKPMP